MSTFTAVELSKLPVPDLTEQVSFEQSYADLKATLYLLAPEYATLLESDPMSVLLQVCAYREVHLRESFNVRGKGNMLAYAGGADLDNLGAFQRWFGFQPNTKVATLVFGLFHGFGLATKLQDFQLSPDGLLVNLVAFNIGVEIGQLLALGAILIVMGFWRRSESFFKPGRFCSACTCSRC